MCNTASGWYATPKSVLSQLSLHTACYLVLISCGQLFNTSACWLTFLTILCVGESLLDAQAGGSVEIDHSCVHQ